MLRARLAAAMVAVAAATGCGEAGSGAPADRDAAARGFLTAMVPHHRGAVEMAAVARTEARHGFVRSLARSIERSQATEIAEMERMHQRLFGAPLRPDMAGHAALGLSMEEAGMGHMDGAATLRGKRPFDRAFVDEMVPHHEGAVRMAEAVGTRTADPGLRALAGEIVVAQKREIAAMSRFRERAYGGPVPKAPGGHAG